MTKTRGGLATLANRLAELSRSPGAPTLSDGASRETLIAWLQWNDPNGCHTDSLAAIEGCDPYTEDTAWEALETVLSDNV